MQERFQNVLNNFGQTARASSEEEQAINLESDQFARLDRINIAAPPSSTSLGQGVSERFSNLEDLSELDLSQASPEELNEAAAVISNSLETLDERGQQADNEVAALRNERNVFANVAQALDGTANLSESEEIQAGERTGQLQRDAQAVQELIQQFDTQRSQNPVLTPGSPSTSLLKGAIKQIRNLADSPGLSPCTHKSEPIFPAFPSTRRPV